MDLYFALITLIIYFGLRILISIAITIPVIYLIVWYLNHLGYWIMIRFRWVASIGILVGITVGVISWYLMGQNI